MFTSSLQSIALILLALMMLATTTNAAFRGDGQVCSTKGATCSASSDCCWGLCQEGTCRPCTAMRGQVCMSNDDCCGQRVCSAAGICAKPDTELTTKPPQDQATVEPVATDPPLASASWPEAFGKTGEEAKALILATNPSLYVEILLKDAPATEDWRSDRVRVRVDSKGIVVEVPTFG